MLQEYVIIIHTLIGGTFEFI